MSESTSPPPTNTQGSRRLKYGLNVLVAAVAAVLLVVAFNWMIDWQVHRVGPAARHWLRYDLTATRQYSLSEQTIKLLGNLKNDVQIVTLFRAGGPEVDRTSDLIDEYGRVSNRVKVDHINPDRGVTRLEDFYKKLSDRYSNELVPVQKAIDGARKAVDQLREDAPSMVDPLRKAAADPNLKNERLKQTLQAVLRSVSGMGDQLKSVNQQLDTDLKDTMPDYAGARTALQQLITELDGRFFSIAIDAFDRAAQDASTPASVKDNLLGLIDRFKQTRSRLKEAAQALQDAPQAEQYDKVRRQIATNPNTIVLMDAKQVQVLWLEDMFRTPASGGAQQGQPQRDNEPLFLGEERITGTLVSMQMDRPPLIVFVTTGQDAALGQRGGFNEIAQRLRNLNFRVEEWNPMGGPPGPMGQPAGPQEPPQPEPGQKVVWVVMPSEPGGPMNPMAGMGAQQAVEHVRQRLDAGDAVFFNFTASQAAMFGQTDPAAQLVDTWGITPQLDRIVLREVTRPDQKPSAGLALTTDRWPDATPIGKALSGQRGMFLFASPLTLANNPSNKAKVWPLVTISGDGLWAEKNWQAFPNLKKDPATSADSFILGAAAEHDGHRIIVIGCAVWATDRVTTNADPNLQAPGYADMFGAAYPANAELFVNGIYWLTGMDQLIAAGARTQDIRRVGDIKPSSMTSLRWALLAGLPLAVLAMGVGVWTVRRRA